MKKKLLICNLFWMIMLCAGCQFTPRFTVGYDTTFQTLLSNPINGTLAVQDFKEARAPRVYSTAGKLFLTYVPLLPYVSMPFERLDESVEIQSRNIKLFGKGMTWVTGARQNVAPPFEEYTYPVSFARAIADDIRASGLFKDVVFVSEKGSSGHRYLLTGKVLRSPYQWTATSYMLGAPGVLLWILPIPMSKVSAEVEVDLVLRDTRTGEIIWTYKLLGNAKRYITLYTSSAMIYGRGGVYSMNIKPPPRKSKVDRRSLFGWHFECLRRGMVTAKYSLADALAED